MSASTKPARAEPPVLPFTRKYIGSKRQLRDRLADEMIAAAGVPATFLDGFFGTGAVGVAMAARGAGRVIAVDTLRSNCVILRGFLAKSGRIARLMDRLNSLAPVHGYVSESYAGAYFTTRNCGRMDAIREEIERLSSSGGISAGERDILLASFLLSADRVANTLGQYDAFLKNIDRKSMVDGRHLVDGRVSETFALRPLEPLTGARIKVREGDMIEIAPRLDVEVAYFDPPYNGRQYCDNYHVLENLARWEKPPLFGKTRKFDRAGLRSPFSQRQHAAAALRALVTATRARHIFLSYSSEGILDRERIATILSTRGRVETREIPYPVFGNGAGVSTRRTVIEYLFHVTVEGA
ncbi:MAG TPA: DNA adenine methylase [Spirochaetia bacterium]